MSLADSQKDTLILQLGYILLSVPNWKKAFKLRILVFVEYDTEVDEEKARLKGLLEKLRIDAEVQVFWLASGALATYEYVVNGKVSKRIERAVDQLLQGDEWWEELKTLRHDASKSKGIYHLGDLLDIGRRKSFFPSTATGSSDSPRPLSTQGVLGLPKTSNVSRISKFGANFGIRTHHLATDVLDNGTNQPVYNYNDDEPDSSSSSDADFNDVAEQGNIDDTDSQSQPLLRSGKRKDLRGLHRQHLSHQAQRTSASGDNTPTYGATNNMPALSEASRPSPTPFDSFKRAQGTRTLSDRTSESAQTGEPRPSIARQPTRPVLSRNSSMGRFSSRPVPETRMQTDEGGGQRLVFAEEAEPPRTPFIRSRRNSISQKAVASDIHLNIPGLLESYDFDSPNEAETRSTYSTQSLPLSFNGLPSRAQHLILNELLQQNSNDTAVVLTTLPIPEEGTCKSEEASLKYLSDIEVLCHELPPVLLVLSNNMTVTVSL